MLCRLPAAPCGRPVTHVNPEMETRMVLMTVETRVFLGIDAFC